MRNLVVAYHPAFLAHDAGPGHPDRPERVKNVMKALKKAAWADRVVQVKAREAELEELAWAHNLKYVKAMRRLCEAGGEFLPGMQSAVGPETWPAAVRAAGAGLTLADSIMKGDFRLGFAPTRPPGHHATWERPQGFCVFNNMVVLTHYLLNKYNLERIAIIDFDVHHGNGTQAAFYSDPRVLFGSLHRADHYPSDTSDWHDDGEGAGKGFTINVPLSAATNDTEYLQAFDRYIIPPVTEFKPQILLVSAGFDAHQNDIIGGMKLTAKGFAGIGERIKILTDNAGEGKIISLLEGGYDLKGLAEGVGAYFNSLMEE
ncbi:MAG: histone deacetylase [Calditrichota bacterium]